MSVCHSYAAFYRDMTMFKSLKSTEIIAALIVIVVLGLGITHRAAISKTIGIGAAAIDSKLQKAVLIDGIFDVANNTKAQNNDNNEGNTDF